MDQLRSAEVQYRIEHRHSDGSWSPMYAQSHDSAERDPERNWLRRMVFRCGSCGEVVEVMVEAGQTPPLES
jgi:hypothetical protein